MSLATLLGAVGGCASPLCWMGEPPHWDYAAQAFSGAPTTVRTPPVQAATQRTTAATFYASGHTVGSPTPPASWMPRRAGDQDSAEMVAAETHVRPEPADLVDAPRRHVRPAFVPPPVDTASTDTTDGRPEEGSIRRTAWVPPAHDGHLMRTNRVKLNYHVNVPGAAGVATVELWCTEDGHTWAKRADLPAGRHSCVLHVDADGLYGFTVVACRGDGLAQLPPRDGDKPQILVEVDQTRPVVQILGTCWAGTAEEPAFRVSWKASDRNLVGRPVSLSYGDGDHGPWHLVAGGLAAAGTYLWTLPAHAPEHLVLRVQALDAAGNVGATQMSLSSTLGGIVPSADVTSVEDGSDEPEPSLSDTDGSRFPSDRRSRYR
jgi:hypothetical protein